LSAKPSGSDFTPVFAALKKILAAHAASLVVACDEPGDYKVNSTKVNPRNKQPFCVGMVCTGKNYVSYHLMPAYGMHHLISPALKKRMQGKACFNFTAIDEPLFAELADLTARGCAAFKQAGYA
jgi:hypothetical protein